MIIEVALKTGRLLVSKKDYLRDIAYLYTDL